MGKLKAHSPTYCMMDNWENMLYLTHTLNKAYSTGIQCLQISLHNDYLHVFILHIFIFLFIISMFLFIIFMFLFIIFMCFHPSLLHVFSQHIFCFLSSYSCPSFFCYSIIFSCGKQLYDCLCLSVITSVCLSVPLSIPLSVQSVRCILLEVCAGLDISGNFHLPDFHNNDCFIASHVCWVPALLLISSTKARSLLHKDILEMKDK